MTDKENLKAASLRAGATLPSSINGRIYTIKDVLGIGGFGITYKATDEKGRLYAIKECFRQGFFRKEDGKTMSCPNTLQEEYRNALKDFEKEADRLISLRDKTKHIVQVVEKIKAYDTMYYAMEFLNGGNLREYTKQKPLPEKRAIEIMTPIFKAVTLLHSGADKFLHLDIKPDNITMTEDVYGESFPVLIDFGAAKHFDSSGALKSSTSIAVKGVTPGYSPIEQYMGVDSFDARLDVYALGATMFYLLTGTNPKKPDDITAEYLRQALRNNSLNVQNAVIHAMKKDKTDRTPSVEQFYKELNGLSQQNTENSSSPKDKNTEEKLLQQRVNPTEYIKNTNNNTNHSSINNSNDTNNYHNRVKIVDDEKKVSDKTIAIFIIGVVILLMLFIWLNKEDSGTSSATTTSTECTPTEEVWADTPTTTPCEAAY